MAEASLELLQSLMQRSLDGSAEIRRELGEVRRELGEARCEQAELRRQNGDMRSIMLVLADQGRRIERKVGEVRDEIELMAKSELVGRLEHFETLIEARLVALAPHAT